MAKTDIVIRGAREHNLRDVSLDLASGPADLLHRGLGLGQELAGVRHALCRGAAALRREPLELRPPVPGPDAQARGRPDRRASARRSRSSRRPAAATRGRPSARSPRSTTTSACSSPGSARGIAPMRPAGRRPDPRADRRPHPGDLPAGTAFLVLAPVDPRAEGRIQGPVRRPGRGGLRAGAGQRPGRQPVRQPRARPPDQAPHRGRHRPAQGRSRAIRTRGWPRRSSRRSSWARGRSSSRSRASPTCCSRRITPARSAGSSFDPPSPQLFSFNSPQGMCLACDGLGVRHDFDPDLLVPDPSLSVWDGAIAPLGPVKDMGKWRRHIFEGVAANFEADPDGPAKGTMLKGPWRKLDEKWRRRLACTAPAIGDRPPLEEPAARSGRTPRNGTAWPPSCWPSIASAAGGPTRRSSSPTCEA